VIQSKFELTREWLWVYENRNKSLQDLSASFTVKTRFARRPTVSILIPK
jgi:hypothetical protein